MSAHANRDHEVGITVDDRCRRPGVVQVEHWIDEVEVIRRLWPDGLKNFTVANG